MSDSLPLRMALLNMRSVVNKTFILHDFFISQELDFMFMTETWTKVGDFSPFSELVPQNCSYFSFPRSSKCGGGLAAVFKNSFHCRAIPTDPYKSFEVQLLLMDLVNPVLCVVVYRPPQPNNVFLNEFIGNVATKHEYNSMNLILGDFNIYVCCLGKL